jgi:xanthine dehydrogenase small subunit
MRDHVLLYVNGRRLEVRGPAAFVPLSTFLRQHLELTGTKVVCAEGDCGACAVLVGRPPACGAGVPPAESTAAVLHYQPITSCIAMVAQLDRTHIITVEGLAQNGQPHPVQQAMIACHASQCGYCTPGFAVTLAGLSESAEPLSPDAIRAGLVGNLCRCTGYESILAAGAGIDRANLRPLNVLHPPAALLADFAATDEGLRLTAPAQTLFQPTTLVEALDFKATHPSCTLLAGGTDLGVQVNKGTRTLDTILSLAAIPDLKVIHLDADTLTACASTTLTDLERATKESYPELYPMLARHGSPLIRNAGTLAGNIANGSPIGDALPALYALNAEVELAGLSREAQISTRRVGMNAFFTAYKRTVMRPDELITAVHIPRLKPDETLRLYKVSKRRDLDISTFTAAIFLKRTGGTIREARLAYGGVGPNILRLPKTESLLRDQPISEDLFHLAGRLARAEITPISDVRGDAAYRLQLAENILLKLYYELIGPDQADPMNGDGHDPDATHVPHRSPLVPPPSTLE